MRHGRSKAGYYRFGEWPGSICALTEEITMSQHFTAEDELLSDVVACQLVIKQILDVIDVFPHFNRRISSFILNLCFIFFGNAFLINRLVGLKCERCH